jgi:hypothetical protein
MQHDLAGRDIAAGAERRQAQHELLRPAWPARRSMARVCLLLNQNCRGQNKTRRPEIPVNTRRGGEGATHHWSCDSAPADSVPDAGAACCAPPPRGTPPAAASLGSTNAEGPDTLWAADSGGSSEDGVWLWLSCVGSCAISAPSSTYQGVWHQ